jgi:hypothetical protein
MASAQDYRAVARIISDALGEYAMAEGQITDHQAHDALEEVATDLADYYAEDNSRFDRQRFMTAAGFPYTADPWEDQR